LEHRETALIPPQIGGIGLLIEYIIIWNCQVSKRKFAPGISSGGELRSHSSYNERDRAGLRLDQQWFGARRDEVLRRAFETNGGRVVKTTGDGFHVVFESPAAGIAAALAGQEAIAAEEWPPEIGTLKVRMGLHCGESKARNSDFYGTELNRAARVMGIAHG